MSTGDLSRKDLWIPGCFVLFFVFLAGLQTWFVLLANETFSGVVTDNAYSIGLSYDDVLAQREAESRLGWVTALTFEQGDEMGGRLTFTIRDRDGRAVDVDEVRATAERITRFPQILTVPYVRGAEGVHHATMSLPLAGRWFIRARIQRSDDVVHVIDEIDVHP